MLEDILATLPNEVTKNLKSQDFWPIFTRCLKVEVILYFVATF